MPCFEHGGHRQAELERRAPRSRSARAWLWVRARAAGRSHRRAHACCPLSARPPCSASPSLSRVPRSPFRDATHRPEHGGLDKLRDDARTLRGRRNSERMRGARTLSRTGRDSRASENPLRGKPASPWSTTPIAPGATLRHTSSNVPSRVRAAARGSCETCRNRRTAGARSARTCASAQRSVRCSGTTVPRVNASYGLLSAERRTRDRLGLPAGRPRAAGLWRQRRGGKTRMQSSAPCSARQRRVRQRASRRVRMAGGRASRLGPLRARGAMSPRGTRARAAAKAGAAR
jgi:hypothetical protein